eukprot:s1205_g19.t1
MGQIVLFSDLRHIAMPQSLGITRCCVCFFLGVRRSAFCLVFGGRWRLQQSSNLLVLLAAKGSGNLEPPAVLGRTHQLIWVPACGSAMRPWQDSYI